MVFNAYGDYKGRSLDLSCANEKYPDRGECNLEWELYYEVPGNSDYVLVLSD